MSKYKALLCSSEYPKSIINLARKFSDEDYFSLEYDVILNQKLIEFLESDKIYEYNGICSTKKANELASKHSIVRINTKGIIQYAAYTELYGTPTFSILKIVEIDTSKIWTIETYDDGTSIRYFEKGNLPGQIVVD